MDDDRGAGKGMCGPFCYLSPQAGRGKAAMPKGGDHKGAPLGQAIVQARSR